MPILEIEMSLGKDADVRAALHHLAAAVEDALGKEWLGTATFVVVRHRSGVRLVVNCEEEVPPKK